MIKLQAYRITAGVNLRFFFVLNGRARNMRDEARTCL